MPQGVPTEQSGPGRADDLADDTVGRPD